MLLFDGVCNLCNASINFVIDQDEAGYFKFAPLQSEVAATLLSRYHLDSTYLDSVVLIENGRHYQNSEAALRAARRLGPPWAALFVFMVVPGPLRDLVYRWIARNRYRWFGQRDQCRLPTPDLRARFL